VAQEMLKNKTPGASTAKREEERQYGEGDVRTSLKIEDLYVKNSSGNYEKASDD
jgi:hypothetical protein